MKHEAWTCPKCGNEEFEVGEMRASGSSLAGIFDVSNQKFSSVTCMRCQYTEFYRTTSNAIEKVLDFFAT